MFSGSIPALVTPFRDGAFDEKGFRRLVDWQIESGSNALVPCGTTNPAAASKVRAMLCLTMLDILRFGSLSGAE